ncbi:MAG: hypothetical protein A2Z99_01215 [Treponema sp. GWB1_62_6]|nr:MAG: hypothetical protein A2Z99_01215 [Treponema sp. GWB1_62_6]OHE68993.1 MAG: hypothetical protein A2001_18285 [Treponema sp. GWC1_61_84]OHE69954.1 MAG: hypothetical protein A2413_00820 [Treponema sp. RIFOXYC1_FULL_61_9]HCM28516.1 hypothetical protein [Treponema sp.]
MGLFDTLILDPPLVCPRCGKAHESMQTKLFDSSMSTYRPGMIVPGCPVHTGILKDHTWCCPTEHDEHGQLDVWIIIWHGVFADYALDTDTAELRLAGMDRLDLLDWLDRMQKTALEWKNRYHALYRDLSDWVEYRDLPEEDRAPPEEAGESKAARFRRSLFLIRLPEVIRNDPDPLRRILERNDLKAEPDTGFFGW